MFRSSARSRILLFMAWRNIWRNPVRSLLTTFSMSAGVALVLIYSALLEGMTEQMADYATEISTGHLQLHRQAYIDDQDIYATLPWAYLHELEQRLPQMLFAPRLYAAALASSGDFSSGVLIKAVDFTREARATRLLQQLSQGSLNETANAHSVYIGSQLARNQKLALGDELILMSQAVDGSIGNDIFYVRGIFKSVEPAFDRGGVLMSIEAYQSLMYLEKGFHELLVIGENVNDVEPARQALAHELDLLQEQVPLDDFGGALVLRSWREISAAIADMLAMSRSMIWIIGFIILCLSSLGVLNTMLMAIHERHFEFGILMAIGMKPRFIMMMLLMESIFLGLIASVFGCVLALVFVWYFDGGIDFSAYMPEGFDWAGMVFEPVFRLKLVNSYFVLVSILLILVTLLATILPALKTLRLKPAEIL